jgi:site-specific DNA recombinase
MMGSASRLSCFGACDQGTCSNKLTVRRDEVEARVLNALQEKLLRHDPFEELCDEFTREMNRLRMEHCASLSAAERKIEHSEARRKKLVESIMEGVPASEVRDELRANAARRDELSAKLAAADEPHRSCIRGAVSAEGDRPRAGARASRHAHGGRGSHSRPRGRHHARPDRSEFQIELKGNLAAMLSAAEMQRDRPKTGDLLLQVAMVAGLASYIICSCSDLPPKHKGLPPTISGRISVRSHEGHA